MMQLAKSAATTTSSPSASSSVSLVPSVGTTPSTTTALVSEVPSQLTSVAIAAQEESVTGLSEGEDDNSLSDIFVPLDTIQPGELVISS